MQLDEPDISFTNGDADNDNDNDNDDLLTTKAPLTISSV
jgi:hypothetical protein